VSTNATDLLPPELIARLDRLDVVSRKILSGKMRGERRSKRRGQSVEFADFRNYVPGDDLRFIDWNIYARLDKLFLKVFLEEEDLALYILIDTSRSSSFGNPQKLLFMKRVAATLGYIGLVNYNRVSVAAVNDQIVAETGAMRGRRKVSDLIAFLEPLNAAGATDLGQAFKRFRLSAKGRGVCVVLSDFLDKRGIESSLRYLAGTRFDLVCMQVLAPQELKPFLQGDLRLEDVEDADYAEVSITQPLLSKYTRNLNAYCMYVNQYVSRRGGVYLLCGSDADIDSIVISYLRKRRLLG
jgi:uncharacterized protein (DUF58 family)